MDAKATDSFREGNLSANYSCGLLRSCLESDWSQNNKHSCRNNFRRSWFNGFHCKLFFFCTFCFSVFLLCKALWKKINKIQKKKISRRLLAAAKGSMHELGAQPTASSNKLRAEFFRLSSLFHLQLTYMITSYIHSHLFPIYGNDTNDQLSVALISSIG